VIEVFAGSRGILQDLRLVRLWLDQGFFKFSPGMLQKGAIRRRVAWVMREAPAATTQQNRPRLR